MWSNSLKTAWRNLVGNKLYGALNIAGLAVGMSVSFLLLLYVWHEYSYDRSQPNADRIYLTHKNQPVNGSVRTKPLSPQPLAAVLQKDFPQIERTARTSTPADNLLFSVGNKSLRVTTVAADSSLTDMFHFDYLAGNPHHSLDGRALVLTQSVAKALFGQEDPVGKTVEIAKQYPLIVKAVVKDNPDNTSLQFQALMSWEAYLQQKAWVRDLGWDDYAFATYVMLKPKAKAESVNDAIADLIGKYNPGDKHIKLFLYPLTQLHLYSEFRDGVASTGRIGYIRLFFFLAIGILLVAAINFMNLATARSQKRAREVGVRKAIGARRISLVLQFLAESVLFALIALILATGLMAACLPLFDIMIHIPLTIPYDQPAAWGIACTITIATGLLAGSYPALFLSSFQPVKVLKGKLLHVSSAIRPRQVLVVTQFSFAIALIIVSLAIYKQIGYIGSKPVGYDRNGLIAINLDGTLASQFDAFRREAIDKGYITDAAVTSEAITDNNQSAWSVIWPGQQPGEDRVPIDCMGAGAHFLETYGLRLEQGKGFDPHNPGDSSAVMLNQAAVKLMRMSQPVGQEITWLGTKHKVVGVVENFVWGSPYEPVKPAIIGFVPDWSAVIGCRLNPAHSISAGLAGLQDLYRKYNPGYPFAYRFTDEDFAAKFKDEKLLGSVSLSFTALAIFISCLGLFGLSAFSAEQRKKELGIRKVLGAPVPYLWLNLSGEFIRLVLIAFVIGSAASAYIAQSWLHQYSFHAGLDPLIFVLTLTGALFVCLLAVGWQALQAATANPIYALKEE